MKNIEVGLSASITITVGQNQTALSVGSGTLDVFATPMMIALMENAAAKCIAPYLDSGETSVGTMVSVAHSAACVPGTLVSAAATVTAVDGRIVEFTVTASDSAGEIGSGRHTRVMIDEEKFMAKVGEKAV